MTLLHSINGIAVLTTALLSVALSSIWYSPIFFGAGWLRDMQRLHESEKLSEVMKHTIVLIVFQGIFFFALAYLSALVVQKGLSLRQVSFALGILVTIPLIVNAYAERKPLLYAFLTAGYTLAILVSGLGIIFYWPW